MLRARIGTPAAVLARGLSPMHTMHSRAVTIFTYSNILKQILL